MTSVPLKYKLIDIYIQSSILFDVLFIIIILILEIISKMIFVYYGWPLFKVLDANNQTNYMFSLISTIVALSGFMIAALTILITVKASLKARGFNDAGNALEYIFTTDRYFEIVGVFTTSITELVILLICCYLVWLNNSNISSISVTKFLFCSTFAMAMATIRSVGIFFKTLRLENKTRSKNSGESNDEKQTRLLEEILSKISK